MKPKIYLDNNATTKPDPAVVEAVLKEFSLAPANPSSVHSFGQAAKQRLSQYRSTIANTFDVKPHEILFTSGGTEGLNLLLRGKFQNKSTGHIISSSIEHSAVHHTLIDLQRRGIEVTLIPPEPSGEINPAHIEEKINEGTTCLCFAAVNPETGVKNDLDTIAQIAKKHNLPLFVDGVAWLGKEEITLHPAISGIAFSGHKFHAPQGTGFIILRTKLEPTLTGALQEQGMRAGTENLPGIAGIAKAIERLSQVLPEATYRMQTLRDTLQQGLLEICPDATIHGTTNRICNTLNISLGNHSGEDLLIALDMQGIAVSHGSACSSGALEPSRVLTQMGIPFKAAKSALRFSLCRDTTEDEISQTLAIIKQLLQA